MILITIMKLQSSDVIKYYIPRRIFTATFCACEAVLHDLLSLGHRGNNDKLSNKETGGKKYV